MAQLNVLLTPEFEAALGELMRLRHVPTQADAIRMAVEEAVEREHRRKNAPDFTRWLGMAARGPRNPSQRFRSDDDLWR